MNSSTEDIVEFGVRDGTLGQLVVDTLVGRGAGVSSFRAFQNLGDNWVGTYHRPIN